MSNSEHDPDPETPVLRAAESFRNEVSELDTPAADDETPPRSLRTAAVELRDAIDETDARLAETLEDADALRSPLVSSQTNYRLAEYVGTGSEAATFRLIAFRVAEGYASATSLSAFDHETTLNILEDLIEIERELAPQQELIEAAIDEAEEETRAVDPQFADADKQRTVVEQRRSETERIEVDTLTPPADLYPAGRSFLLDFSFFVSDSVAPTTVTLKTTLDDPFEGGLLPPRRFSALGDGNAVTESDEDGTPDGLSNGDDLPVEAGRDEITIDIPEGAEQDPPEFGLVFKPTATGSQVVWIDAVANDGDSDIGVGVTVTLRAADEEFIAEREEKLRSKGRTDRVYKAGAGATALGAGYYLYKKWNR